MNYIKRFTTSLVLLCCSGTAAAGSASFDFDATVGLRSDSSVALADIDTLAGESDTATQLDVGATAKIPLGDALRLELGYDFSATDYDTLDAFDLDLHHGRAALGLQLGATDAHLAVDRFDGNLDGDDYVTVTQVSPSLSRLLGQRLYVRLAYTRSDTRYAFLEQRDATGDAIRGDAYWLLNGMSHFVALTLETNAEDARDDAFDYDGVAAALSWGYTLGSRSRSPSLRAGLRYEERDFDRVQEDGMRRVDERVKARLTAELPVTDFLTVSALAERSRNESVLDAADLDRTVYGLEVGVSF